MSKKKLSSQSSRTEDSTKCMAAFRIFGDIPTLAIIHFVSDGPKRFNELERLTGINPVTLTNRLKRLTKQRVIKRSEHKTDKQAVSYSLDILGKKALPIMKQIEKFTMEAIEL